MIGLRSGSHLTRNDNLQFQFRRAEPWLYVGPALFITVFLALSPVVYLTLAVFKKMELGDPISKAPYIGMQNFSDAFYRSENIVSSMRLSVTYTVFALTIELLIGLGIASLIEGMRRSLPFFMSIFLVPMVLMPAMVAMVWRLYFSFDGLVNWVIGLLSLGPVTWFSMDHALSAVIITDVWQWTPFFILLFVAGLQNVPRDIKEAAEVDGASEIQILYAIKLPMLLPLIIIASTLRVMELVRQFDLAFIMFGGGPGSATMTMPLAVFSLTVKRANFGAGSVLSLILIGLVIALSWLFVALMKRFRTS